MNNEHFTHKLEASKNQIFHFLSKHEREFFVCLNGKYVNGKQFKREKYAGAHYYMSFQDEKELGWKQELYYFTYNVSTWFGVRSFTIRKDYIDFASQSKHLDILYFIVLDYENQKIWKVPAKDVKKRIYNKTASIVNDTVYENVVINLTNDDYCEDMCFEEAQKKHEKSFDPNYWEPRYIENFVYATHHNATNTKVIVINKTSHKQYMNRTFKSIKEAFDFSKGAGYDKSYKTFQRAAAKSTIIEGQDTFVFITTDMNAKNPFDDPEIFIGKELWKEAVVEKVENNATKEEVEEFADTHEPEVDADIDEMDNFVRYALPGLVEFYDSIEDDDDFIEAGDHTDEEIEAHTKKTETKKIIEETESESVSFFKKWQMYHKEHPEVDYMVWLNNGCK